MTKAFSYIPRIPKTVDLLVIGGGINGCGIARDAAGRGLKVLLVEQNDLASGTSSASSKLIHGGLRYLENYDFSLVRQSLRERRRLMRLAPHLVTPLRFILPHTPEQRPRWMIRLGLMLYDVLGGRRGVPASRAVALAGGGFAPLKPEFRQGFSYHDCWTDDARLVVENAIDAARIGAWIATRTTCRKLLVESDTCWRAELQEQYTGATLHVRARSVINAGGPWADEVLRKSRGRNPAGRLRLVKGSHIILRRFHTGEHAFTLQNSDGRIIFVIPMSPDFLLIGTTEEEFAGNPASAAISKAERDYLIAAVARYFDVAISDDDIVGSFSGVRPLVDESNEQASAVSREHRIVQSSRAGEPPMLAVLGGKLTTYRQVAEEATNRLCKALDRRNRPWTAKSPLPGGHLGGLSIAVYERELRRRYGEVPGLGRLVRTYGSRAEALCRRLAEKGPGRKYAAGLTETELDFLVRTEWVREADDVLWRRGKLGLYTSQDEYQEIADALALYRDRAGAAAETASS